MNLETYNISGEKSGSIDLLDSIYALEPNTNVISTLVDWHKSNIIQSRPTTKK
jgi:ribosomal protein L4